MSNTQGPPPTPLPTASHPSVEVITADAEHQVRPASPEAVKLTVQDRAMAFLATYLAPRAELIFACGLLVCGLLLLLRGTVLSGIVGLLLMLAGVLFLFIVLSYNKATISKEEAKEFLECYYAHPMDATLKPNIEHMSIHDLLSHVARCVERVPEVRTTLGKKYQKNIINDWEGPVRDWVVKYYNRRPETKKEK